jgi:hypothetical protein
VEGIGIKRQSGKECPSRRGSEVTCGMATLFSDTPLGVGVSQEIEHLWVRLLCYPKKE